MRNGQAGGVATLLLRLIIIGLFLAVIVGGALTFEINRRLKADGPLAEDSILWIEKGDTVSKISDKLVDMGALPPEQGPLLFRIASRLDELAPDLRAGEFEIDSGASIREIVTHLKTGDPILRFVTVPEGRTSAQVVRILNETPMLTGEVAEVPAEGTLLPETYSYHREDSRAHILDRMAQAHDVVLAELWETRAEGLPFNTPEEAVILASIVEKETGIAEERPLVAAVFVNRLKRGMRLQSDPTIIYGLTGGEPLGRGIRQTELAKETPYNTYVIRGLPPTPIANPGRDALAAVLNPADSDALYFVADGSGGHAFASSLAEHNRNVQRWRRIERERRQEGNTP